MTKYRKKPVEIEAFKFYVDAFPDWFTDAVTENQVILRNCNYGKYSIDEARCEIKTLEGNMVANGGDYIIKGIKGELYPCKPDVFKATYEEVGKLNLSTTIDIDLVVDKLSKKLEESISELRSRSQITINKEFSKVDMKGFKSCEALTIKKP